MKVFSLALKRNEVLCLLTSTLPFANVKTSRSLTPRAAGSQQRHKPDAREATSKYNCERALV